MESKKLLITAAFGACFKNLFLNEDFMDKVSQRFSEVLIVSPVQNDLIQNYFNFIRYKNVSFKLIPEKNNLIQIVSSQLSVFSYNLFIKSNSFKIRQKDGVMLPSQRFLIFIAKIFGKVIGLYRAYLFFDTLRLKNSFDRECEIIFDEFKPDIVFSASSSFRYDFSAIYSAKKRSIPVVGMVFSWDNLSTKGPIYRKFSKVIVWNKFQRDELKPFYDYRADQVVESGIPQLDYFLKTSKNFKRSNLDKQLNLKQGEKLITYATGSPVIVPHEAEIISEILSELEKTDIKYRFHIRVHPRDDISEYAKLKKRKNVTLESSSREMIKTVDGLFFDKNDVLHYGELLKFSDVVLNVSSTVGLEAVVLNTPVINIGYDGNPYYKSVKRYLDFDHMRIFNSLKSYKNANSVDDVIKFIKQYLQNRSIDASNRIAAAKIINRGNDGCSGERIAQEIIEEAYEKN